MGSQFAGPFVFHTEEEPHDLGWEFHAPAINESRSSFRTLRGRRSQAVFLEGVAGALGWHPVILQRVLQLDDASWEPQC